MAAGLDGRVIEFKLEHLQHTGSFKARGAFNNLLSRDVPPAGIVAASGGNHGAATAYAAVQLGYPAQIFVPEFAGHAKIDLIRSTGAQCTVVAGTYTEALSAALDHEERTGAIQLHAFDAFETVAGQGTLFAEWEEQGLNADTVLIAVGGGGLIGGALAWFQDKCKIIAVEPERAPTMAETLVHGPNTKVEVGGIAANALGAQTLGQITYDLAKSYPPETVLVSDDAIAAAQLRLWRDFRLLVEPAGATALSALTSGVYKPGADERVAVLLCGGNISELPTA